MTAPHHGAPIAETELGLERRCNACDEWWPLDEEFFYRQPNGYRGFQGICKACKGERRGLGDSHKGRLNDRALIRAMIESGRHPSDIAAHVGCTVRTVYRARTMYATARPSTTRDLDRRLVPPVQPAA